MAKCEKREIPPTPPIPQMEYVLTLSDYEAGYLFQWLHSGAVGTSTTITRIRKALQNALEQ